MSNTLDLAALRAGFTGAPDQIAETLPPLHPGEVLREEFMAPLDLSAISLAKALDIPRSRIERIVKEEIGISTDTALRLARYFGTSPQLWLNLQTSFEIKTLEREMAPDLERITPREVAA